MADKVLPQRVSMLGGGWLWVESVFPNHRWWRKEPELQLKQAGESLLPFCRFGSLSPSLRRTWISWLLSGSWIRPLLASGWRSRRPSKSL